MDADSATRLPFFVYGTLKAGHSNHGLWGGAVAQVTPATVVGWSMWASGVPFAVPDAQGVTPGEIITLRADLGAHEAARILSRLDALEGFDPLRPQDSWYRRIEVGARPVERRLAAVTCWMYEMPQVPEGSVPIVGGWTAR